MLAAGACSGEKAAAPANTPPPGAVRVDEATAGTITGKVAFEGTAPQNPAIGVGSDPVCARDIRAASRSRTSS